MKEVFVKNNEKKGVDVDVESSKKRLFSGKFYKSFTLYCYILIEQNDKGYR